MTYNNLSTKPTSLSKLYILKTMFSYWWLAVVSGICFFFAGPVLELLGFDAYERAYNLSVTVTKAEYMQAKVGEFFAMEGMIGLYVSVIILSFIFGIVMFNYLHSKKEIDFYHSQPIPRELLFLTRYLTGVVLQAIPLLITVALMIVIATIRGGGGTIPCGVIMAHLGRICLFGMASYSLSVLAGQLTGTPLTHICLAGVLHFGVPIAAVVWNFLCSTFLQTFAGGDVLIKNMLDYSPLTAYIAFASEYYDYEVGVGYALTGHAFAVLLGIWIGMTALSLVLYKMRPSESTGKSMVYPITEPILKCYLVVMVGLLAGLLFYEISGIEFFIFAVIAFGFLTHMICEVILQKDFRAMLHRAYQGVAFIVVAMLLFAAVTLDWIGYDHYVPNTEDLIAVEVNLPLLEGFDASYYTQGYNGPTYNYYTGDMVAPIGTMMHKIAEEELYNQYNDNDADSYLYFNVVYTLKDGTTVARRYDNVPMSAVKDDFARLYQMPTYKEQSYGNFFHLSKETVSDISIENYISNEMMSFDGNLDNPEIQRVWNALKYDLQNRTWESLQDPPIMRVAFYANRGSYDAHNYTSGNYWISVYPNDLRTIAVCKELAQKQHMDWSTNIMDRINHISAIQIYETTDPLSEYQVEAFIEKGLSPKLDENCPEDWRLVQTLSTPEELAAFRQTVEQEHLVYYANQKEYSACKMTPWNRYKFALVSYENAAYNENETTVLYFTK